VPPHYWFVNRFHQHVSELPPSGALRDRYNLTTLCAVWERFRDQPNAKHGLFGFVQKLHLPFCVFSEVSGDAANEFTANFCHFCPGCLVASKFDGVTGRAGKTAISDAKKIERHGGKTNAGAAQGHGANDKQV
jgi:hypothetical protein